MERQTTISGRSDSSQRTIPTDAEVLDMLAEAECEAYVALSKISTYRVPAEKVYEPKYDWNTADAEKLAESVGEVFASDEHGSHGRRIGRDAARDEGVTVDDLEDDRSLQEAVLTLYWSTIAFEQGPVAQSLISNTTPLQRRRRKNCHHHR